MAQPAQPKIMIFDSGVGGLSVFKDIAKMLPELDVVYAFDNEGYPYGELAPEVLIERVVRYVEVITQRHPVDAVVIACNSASTIVLPALRERFAFPIIGVVPALKPANEIAKKGITLLATPGTVERQYTKDLVEQFVDSAPVHMIGSTELVNMAEAKLRGQSVDLERLRKIVEPIATHSDVTVLGCTHFPLLKPELKQVLGDEITFVDSGEAIARRVASVLGIAMSKPIEQTATARHVLYCSAPEKDPEALSRNIKALGFAPIQHFPLSGA